MSLQQRAGRIRGFKHFFGFLGKTDDFIKQISEKSWFEKRLISDPFLLFWPSILSKLCFPHHYAFAEIGENAIFGDVSFLNGR